MSNKAKIVEGPKGTPSQAFWDGLINGIENCPSVDIINKYVKKLTSLIDKMNAAISQCEKEIYDATLGEFNKCKSEITQYLNDKKTEIQDSITNVTESKVSQIDEECEELEQEIEDLETDIENITAENAAAVGVDAGPAASSTSALYAWAQQVVAWRAAQKTTILGYVKKFKNTISRIQKKYEPVLASVAWWPDTISKLSTYITNRISEITKAISKITNITPPSYPSV